MERSEVRQNEFRHHRMKLTQQGLLKVFRMVIVACVFAGGPTMRASLGLERRCLGGRGVAVGCDVDVAAERQQRCVLVGLVG